ncbi:MAG TPA: hypothetical protein VMN36_13855 [Verrucomicrobiales bacterium]|nr:hypothetical protein [Verrucomicrobiales bacterium]
MVSLPVDVLRGSAEEDLWRLEGAAMAEDFGSGMLWRSTEGAVGAALAPVGAGGIEEAARGVYEAIFSSLDDLYLYRMWNFLPGINRDVEGLEEYRRFNVGRRDAYAARFGDGAVERMPAASAVGCRGDALVTVFVAGRDRPRYVENPKQVPAYCYPIEYGPAPPSFARGTVVQGESGLLGFVAGTASIVGHASVAAGDVAGQIETAVENLEAVLQAMELENLPPFSRLPAEWMRVYLRNAKDLPVLDAALRARFGGDFEPVVLRADICRRELDVELELSFKMAGGGLEDGSGGASLVFGE